MHFAHKLNSSLSIKEVRSPRNQVVIAVSRFAYVPNKEALMMSLRLDKIS